MLICDRCGGRDEVHRLALFDKERAYGNWDDGFKHFRIDDAVFHADVCADCEEQVFRAMQAALAPATEEVPDADV